MFFGDFTAKMRLKCRFLRKESSNLKTDSKFGLLESFNQKEISGYWCHTCILNPLESGFWRFYGKNAVKMQIFEEGKLQFKNGPQIWTGGKL